jgi:hypothetical protein
VSIDDQIAVLFAKDPRAPRILIGEMAAAYWTLILRRSEPQYLPIWREYLIECVGYGIRAASLAAEFDTAERPKAKAKARSKRRR